jgi:hypothetical protein
VKFELSSARPALSALLIPAAICATLSVVAAAGITALLVSNEVGDDYLKFDVIDGVEVSSLDWPSIVLGTLGLAMPILAVLLGLVALAYASRRNRTMIS